MHGRRRLPLGPGVPRRRVLRTARPGRSLHAGRALPRGPGLPPGRHPPPGRRDGGGRALHVHGGLRGRSGLPVGARRARRPTGGLPTGRRGRRRRVLRLDRRLRARPGVRDGGIRGTVHGARKRRRPRLPLRHARRLRCRPGLRHGRDLRARHRDRRGTRLPAVGRGELCDARCGESDPLLLRGSARTAGVGTRLLPPALAERRPPDRRRAPGPDRLPAPGDRGVAGGRARPLPACCRGRADGLRDERSDLLPFLERHRLVDPDRRRRRPDDLLRRPDTAGFAGGPARATWLRLGGVNGRRPVSLSGLAGGPSAERRASAAEPKLRRRDHQRRGRRRR